MTQKPPELKISKRATSTIDPKNVQKAVAKLCENFDEDALEKERGKTRFTGSGEMDWCELANKSETSCDMCMFYGAATMTVFFGAMMPLTFFILRFLVSDLGGSAAEGKTAKGDTKPVEKVSTTGGKGVDSLRFMAMI